MGVKRVDTKKGDKEMPEYRSRLVAKEIKKNERDVFLFRCGPAAGGQESTYLVARRLAGIMC